MSCIQLCEGILERKDINNILEENDWYPRSDLTEHILFNCAMNGTGNIRANARLEFVNAEKQGRLGIIDTEIARIRKAASGYGFANRIKICIIGTLVGSTGSGLAVCLPFYLRHLLKNSIGQKRCEISGYFIGADPFRNLIPSIEIRNRMRANAYACLKELNAFFMRPLISENTENNIRLEFYDNTDLSIHNVPYNQIILLDDFLGDVRFDDFIHNYTQKLFANLIINSLPVLIELPDQTGTAVRNAFTDGMNRYRSTGICQLVYPIKAA